MRGWDPHLSWGAWWRRSSQEWVIPSPLLLVTARQMFTSGPGRQHTEIYFRLDIILVWRMLFSSAVWWESLTRGPGIVVMQDTTDSLNSDHLLSAISVCPTEPDSSSVRVRYISNIQSTFTFAWEEILENIGEYFISIFHFSHADNQRAVHIILTDYKMVEIISDCSVFVMSVLYIESTRTHMKAMVMILINLLLRFLHNS